MKKTPVFHRLMALFLVLVLAFSLTATVFATEASSTESTEPTAEVTGSPVSPSEPEETSAPTQPSTVPPSTVETEGTTVPTTEPPTTATAETPAAQTTQPEETLPPADPTLPPVAAAPGAAVLAASLSADISTAGRVYRGNNVADPVIYYKGTKKVVNALYFHRVKTPALPTSPTA